MNLDNAVASITDEVEPLVEQIAEQEVAPGNPPVPNLEGLSTINSDDVASLSGRDFALNAHRKIMSDTERQIPKLAMRTCRRKREKKKYRHDAMGKETPPPVGK